MKTLSKRREELAERYPVWEKKTIWEMFLLAASEFPERMIYQDSRKTVTYGSAVKEILKTAAAFRKAGVQKGDCVAVNLNNTFEYIAITFALAKLGAVKVPVNRRITVDQKSYIINKTGAVLYVTDKAEDLILRRKCDCLKNIILKYNGRGDKPCVTCWNAFIDGTVCRQQEDAEEDAVSAVMPEEREGGRQEVSADDLCDIIFTSGSTGYPKGVMLTHDMMLRSAFANCLNRGFESGRKVLVSVPLFHVYGYVEGLLSVLFVGGTIVCMQGKTDPYNILRLISNYRVNDMLCVPSILQKVLEVPELPLYDLDSFYAVYCSASVCPDWIWKLAREKLGVREMVTGYGMSEVSGASSQIPPEAPLYRLCNSVGKILTDGFSDKLIEYKVKDPVTLEELGAGVEGELWCRGAIVTKGYFGNHEATRELITKDGWLRTGDLGSIDADGYIVFSGRLNDTYKINGENVSPVFVDHIIAECEDVVHVETVGVPDDKLGWIGVAFVEPVEQCSVCKYKIMEYCNSHLASYQVPKYFFFEKNTEWPRTPNGKITKKMLRAEAVRRLCEKADKTA